MSTEQLAKACAMTRGILAKVTPDQYGAPSTCASWKVRDVVNHIMEELNWFALCVNDGAAPDPDPTRGVDYSAGDVLASYDEGVRASLAAFGASGAQERLLKLPFGEMPGAAFMGIAMNEVFTHGWDLAKSTGQPTDLDPEMATQLTMIMQGFVSDAWRGANDKAPFGSAVQAMASASPADKLAAFLGRQL